CRVLVRTPSTHAPDWARSLPILPAMAITNIWSGRTSMVRPSPRQNGSTCAWAAAASPFNRCRRPACPKKIRGGHLRSLIAVWFVTAASAYAQQVDAYIGVGGATASSNGQQIDTFADGNLLPTPKFGGASTNFGVNVFLNQQFGLGWTAFWRWSSSDYAGIKY